MKSIRNNNMSTLIQPVFLFFFGWLILTSALWGFTRLFPANAVFQTWGTSLFLIVFILLCSGFTAFFMIYIHPVLKADPKRRLALLAAAVLFSSSLFVYARSTGETLMWMSAVNTANLLFFANLLGSWIVDPLKRPVEIIPLCFILALVDIISVFRGPTRKIAETIGQYYQGGKTGPVPAADFILLKIPAPGQEGFIPIMGVSDWTAVVFFTAAAAKFGMNDNFFGTGVAPMMEKRRLSFYLPVSAVGLIAAVLSAHYFNIFLPALPLLTLFFLVYMTIKDVRMREFTAEDWRLMGIAALILSAVFLSVRFVYR